MKLFLDFITFSLFFPVMYKFILMKLYYLLKKDPEIFFVMCITSLLFILCFMFHTYKVNYCLEEINKNDYYILWVYIQQYIILYTC